MTTLLDIRGLDAGYGAIRVVRDLSLHVDEGEIVALLGPNGAGKTTTLLTAFGLASAIGGEVEVLRHAGRAAVAPSDGPSVASPTCPRADRSSAASPPGRTSSSPPAATGRRRRGRSGYFPDLAGHLDRRAGLLSGGQQQMLALARGRWPRGRGCSWSTR